jgi:prepilin-type N-terminal cleavage/methylation domain-containing protein
MTTMSNKSVTKRKGFTIVELLVALALVLFIMSIISQVFVDASEAFRSARSKAELTEKLRFITQTLRADLRSRHFENGRKLSDPDFWKIGPPKSGYFRLEQKLDYSSLDTKSSVSGDNLYIGKPDTGCLIAFTSFLDGQNPGSFHSVNASANLATWLNGGGFSPRDTRFEETNTFNSPDAEVAWFMAPDIAGFSSEYPMQDEPLSPSPTMKVYSLIRRVWPLAPERQRANSNTLSVLADGVSVNPFGFNGGQWATDEPNTDVPTRRALGQAYYPGIGNAASWRAAALNSTAVTSNDSAFVIANNVLSFTVEVLPENGPLFIPLKDLRYFDITAGQQMAYLGSSSRVYDTWSMRPLNSGPGVVEDYSQWMAPGSLTSVPMLPATATPGSLPPKLSAIRVTIRLYDTNNALSPSKTTWQATLVEPL